MPGKSRSSKRAQPSPSLKDKVFGRLKWDTDLDWYSGQVTQHDGSTINVHIGVGENLPEDAIAVARDKFLKILKLDYEFRRAAATENLASYNENWNDGEPIDADEFTRRMAIDYIWFQSDGTVEVNYDDDNMFLGHRIAVYLDKKLKFSWSGISG